ncbi:MAG: hypothetical protein PVI03_06680 [Candidatus Thorarchaeota archaeon]
MGEIEQDTYVTHRKKNHFMRKFQGFGISEKVISLLRARGVKKVRIMYWGERQNDVFECPLDDYDNSVLTYDYSGRLAKGDRQKFVPLNSMALVKREKVK